jgi:RimJ/RimL family protein N-acetyltransferase
MQAQYKLKHILIAYAHAKLAANKGETEADTPNPPLIAAMLQ